MHWDGVKVGLIGLVEREWLATLATINEEDVTYIDYSVEGERLAKQLKQQGCDIVIALTHMRMPNDKLLRDAVPEINVVLGAPCMGLLT
jgi:5'-nucleotidase